MPLPSVWTATPALTPTLTHDRHFLLLIWFFPHSLVALWEIIFKFDVSLLLLLLPLPLLLLRLLSRSLHLFYFISLYVGCVLFCMLFSFLTSFVVVFFALYNLSCVAEDAQRRRLAVSVASSSASVWAWRAYHDYTPSLLSSSFSGTAPTLWLTVNVLPIFSPIAIGNVAILLFFFIAFVVVILCRHLCIRKAKTIRVMFVYFRFFIFTLLLLLYLSNQAEFTKVRWLDSVICCGRYWTYRFNETHRPINGFKQLCFYIICTRLIIYIDIIFVFLKQSCA